MRLPVRTFEVNPEAASAVPLALEDRFIEADTVDAARSRAAAVFAAERRPLRSLSFHADGGLVAYVMPPLPEPEPDTLDERPKRKRRQRGRR